jgi:hypothetical protein
VGARHENYGQTEQAVATATHRSFDPNWELIGAAKELKNAHADAESADVAALIQRLQAMCQLRGLGDPYVYVDGAATLHAWLPGTQRSESTLTR